MTGNTLRVQNGNSIINEQVSQTFEFKLGVCGAETISAVPATILFVYQDLDSVDMLIKKAEMDTWYELDFSHKMAHPKCDIKVYNMFATEKRKIFYNTTSNSGIDKIFALPEGLLIKRNIPFEL